MKSPQQQPRTGTVPLPVSQPAEEALGYESPTYGALAAEIAQSNPVQGYGLDAPVQLRIYPHVTQAAQETKDQYAASFATVEDRVNNEVVAARDQALQWGQYIDSDNARLNLWADTAQAYFNDPTDVPDFLHARFGYAVEEISTGQLPDKLAGLDIGLQVAAGHTRPDIVLSDGEEDIEVAWIDITAEESKDHILGKQGAGWATRPFVSEILYDSLDLDEVLQGMNDPMWAELGGYYAAKNQVVHEEQEGQRTILRNSLIELQDANQYQTGFGNIVTKKKDTRAMLIGLGMNFGAHPLMAAKGALMYTDLNPGPFGFADGGSSIDVARAHVLAQAQPEITRRHGELNDVRAGDLRVRLGARPVVPAITNYIAELDAAEAAEDDLGELIRVGITLDHCLTAIHEGANEAARIEHDYAADPRTEGVAADIYSHLDDFPAHPDFANLRAWRQGLDEVIANGELLGDLIAKSDAYEHYLLQYYNSLDDATVEEYEYLQRLNSELDDDTIIGIVNKYMADHPLP